MKQSTLLIVALFSLAMVSCNKDKDDKKDNPYTIPTLDLEFEVSGHTNLEISYNSPENSNIIGGHNHVVISGYSTFNNSWTISGNGEIEEGLLYTFVLSFVADDLSPGTYTITQAQFGTTEHGYPELINGTINITDATLGQTVPSAEFYSTSGNFSIELEDQLDPANGVNFEGSFTGLHLITN